jgi:hypothetical protein
MNYPNKKPIITKERTYAKLGMTLENDISNKAKKILREGA